MPTPVETRLLVGAWFDAFNTRSIPGMLQLVSEDVILDPNQDARRIGRDAMQAYLVHHVRRFQERADDLVILVSDDGFRAAAEYTLRGSYVVTEQGMPAAAGQAYSLSGGTFFEVEDGEISRVSSYTNRADLIRQVGG